DAIEDTVFNGSYYYGIHVDSQLISPDNSDDFLPGSDSRLEAFLTGIKNNSMNESGTTNPRVEVDSPPSALNFDTMLPGRVFTMAGEQYLYLEDMGNGNHMIIRYDSILNVAWNAQEDVLNSWYDQLDPAVQAMVQPVANSFTTGEVDHASVTFTGGSYWLPTNLEGAVAADLTQVVPGETARAFALSLADVARLTGPSLAFPNRAQRGGTNDTWWWLRTPAASAYAWQVSAYGSLLGTGGREISYTARGVRPAIIIHK
ncbi:DUF6273 domain-containing protein, partial [Lactococcus garvieae]|uniref:DUF6273 domain-containing protein n=1 Tax=Lactococcus garvieae TaxID=1363 RepID=UPI003D178211